MHAIDSIDRKKRAYTELVRSLRDEKWLRQPNIALRKCVDIIKKEQVSSKSPMHTRPLASVQ